MIGALLVLIDLVATGVFLGVLTAGAAFGGWLLWDITVGPSAQAAAVRRRRPRAGGG